MGRGRVKRWGEGGHPLVVGGSDFFGGRRVVGALDKMGVQILTLEEVEEGGQEEYRVGCGRGLCEWAKSRKAIKNMSVKFKQYTGDFSNTLLKRTKNIRKKKTMELL